MTATLAAPDTGSAASRQPARAAAMLVGIVVLGLNLRVSVNAIGALLPEIRSDLGLSGLGAGALTAMPEIVFAAAGLATPGLARRIGRQRLVTAALGVTIAGQLLRVAGGSTPMLFVGTLLTLAAPAVGNVLVPGFIREHFPDRIAALTAISVTALSVGAAAGSGLTIPIGHALGGSWRSALAPWIGVAVIALVPWVHLARRAPATAAAPAHPTVPMRRVAQSGLAWAMAGFFAIQAAQVYVVIGWMGQVLLDAGVGDVQMGALVAMAPIIGISLSIATPMVLRRQHRLRPAMITFGTCSLVGYVGLLIAPVGGAWLWMLCIGLGGGTFPTVLTLVALRASTADGVIALSAFTQCLGYLLGALGPIVFGVLHDATGSWRASLVLMIASLGPMVAIGLRLVRPRSVEVELRRAG